MTKPPRTDLNSARHAERIQFAREQRKQANEFSQDVWQMLRGSRIRRQKFRREYPIPPYTVDFVCVLLKLIVEVDGKEHLTEEGRSRDEVRDKFLRKLGYEVLRIEGFRVTQDPSAVRALLEDAIDERIAQQR